MRSSTKYYTSTALAIALYAGRYGVNAHNTFYLAARTDAPNFNNVTLVYSLSPDTFCIFPSNRKPPLNIQPKRFAYDSKHENVVTLGTRQVNFTLPDVENYNFSDEVADDGVHYLLNNNKSFLACSSLNMLGFYQLMDDNPKNFQYGHCVHTKLAMLDYRSKNGSTTAHTLNPTDIEIPLKDYTVIVPQTIANSKLTLSEIKPTVDNDQTNSSSPKSPHLTSPKTGVKMAVPEISVSQNNTKKSTDKKAHQTYTVDGEVPIDDDLPEIDSEDSPEEKTEEENYPRSLDSVEKIEDSQPSVFKTEAKPTKFDQEFLTSHPEINESIIEFFERLPGAIEAGIKAGTLEVVPPGQNFKVTLPVKEYLESLPDIIESGIKDKVIKAANSENTATSDNSESAKQDRSSQDSIQNNTQSSDARTSSPVAPVVDENGVKHFSINKPSKGRNTEVVAPVPDKTAAKLEPITKKIEDAESSKQEKTYLTSPEPNYEGSAELDISKGIQEGKPSRTRTIKAKTPGPNYSTVDKSLIGQGIEEGKPEPDHERARRRAKRQTASLKLGTSGRIAERKLELSDSENDSKKKGSEESLGTTYPKGSGDSVSSRGRQRISPQVLTSIGQFRKGNGEVKSGRSDSQTHTKIKSPRYSITSYSKTDAREANQHPYLSKTS